jgi:capsular exopolysaccharide synthesis family protein
VTFKDLVRLLRRRWLTALMVFAAVFCGYMAVSAVTERPQYRARARILISTPPLLLSANQGTQWISVSQMDPKTWISIISSQAVRERAAADLRNKRVDVQPEWIGNVSATLDPDGQLAWIEAVGPSPEIAAAIANAYAEQAEVKSRDIANVDLERARAKAFERANKEREVLAAEDDKIRKIRDDARARLSSDNLELDVRKLEEEILSHETRRRDLERRGSTNRLRLERIRSDRSVAEHLQREGVPRLGTASGESRIADSPLVRQVSDRLEALHRDLLAAVRRYTEEHPLVKGLRTDIRQTEIDLTRARIQALGSDIDREELQLRTENELSAIEIRVLEPEVKELRDRLGVLSPVLDEVKFHDRLAQDSRGRISTIETLREQLSAAPESGYVRLLADERAKPEETVRIEMRLRKSWGLALLASVIFGIGFAFVREFIDTTLRTDYDVRRHLDYAVLAVAPRVGSNEVLTLRASRASIMAEIYDTLATVLLSAPSEHASRIFMVTSTNPQEGKTVTSINLAVALARQGKRTLLVDGDMRVPSIHTSLTLPSSPGLSEVLAGSVQLNAEGLLQDSEVPNLKVLPCGVQPESPYELLDPTRMGPIAAQMREMFDIVVFDTPPILRTGDALKISTVADQSLFVVEAGRTEQRQASWAKRLLTNVGARVSGVVLNRAVTDTEEYYYYYGTGAGQSRKEARAR